DRASRGGLELQAPVARLGLAGLHRGLGRAIDASEHGRNPSDGELAGCIPRRRRPVQTPKPSRSARNQAARDDEPASIQRRAARWASAISSCSISWLRSRRYPLASIEPFMDARLKIIWADTRSIGHPSRPDE